MLFASAPMSVEVPSSLGLPPWSGRAGVFGSWSSGEQLTYSDELTRTKVSITCSLATLVSDSRWTLKAQMRKVSAPPVRRRSRSAAGQCMAVCGLLGPSGGIQVGAGCGPSCVWFCFQKNMVLLVRQSNVHPHLAAQHHHPRAASVADFLAFSPWTPSGIATYGSTSFF